MEARIRNRDPELFTFATSFIQLHGPWEEGPTAGGGAFYASHA